MALKDYTTEDQDSASKYSSKGRSWSDEDILQIIRELHNEHGKVVLSMFDEDAELPSSWKAKNTFSSWSRAKELAGVGEPTLQCTSCGEHYKKLSRHCTETDCNLPELNKEQKEILVGLMMGDATLTQRKTNNPSVNIVNTNREFLKWLNEKLNNIAYPVRFIKDAEEQMEHNIENGMTNDPSLSDYNDVYSLYTMCHTDFKHLDWIEDGSKTIPDSINLTPTVVKMWFASDGSLHWRGDRNKAEARITNVTEKDELSKFSRMFDSAGFDVRVGGKEIQFNIQQTKKLFSWMGKPPSGMEYKWQFDDRDKYEELKGVN